MNPMNLPKMVYSYGDGWLDLVRIHPTVAKLFTTYVMPMSLIPPAMYVYASVVVPGSVFPAQAPAFCSRPRRRPSPPAS